MNKDQIEDIYPLSPMQQGMLFHTLFSPESGLYFEQITCVLRGALNAPAFERAWQRVVDRHPALRTLFAWERRDQPLQLVLKPGEVPIRCEQQDWRGLGEAERAERVEAFLKIDQARGFTLSKAPLMRLALLRTSDDAYQFVWSRHHILLDGWSAGIVLKDVFADYVAECAGVEAAIAPVRPYRDYIAWLQTQSLSAAEHHWRQVLGGVAAPAALPIDQGPGRGDLQHYATLERHLTAGESARLVEFARRHKLTLNTLLQGALALLLLHYTGETDVVFGAVVSGRPVALDDVEQMVGLFVNSLPVRIQIDPGMALLPWLQAIQAQQADARHYDYSPLAQVQDWAGLPKGRRLFETLLVVENYPIDDSLSQHGPVTVEAVRYLEPINYPLTLYAVPGTRLVLRVDYDRQRFEPAAIERLLAHFQTLLLAIEARPLAPLSQLSLLTEAERTQLLDDWSGRREGPQHGPALHQWVEAQAQRTPHAPAVHWSQESWTYAQLNARANRLAHDLRRRGVGPEQCVAVCLERTPDLIASLLAVLKAGGAYVPLDPAYPAWRMQLALDETRAPVLITQRSLCDRLPPGAAQVVCVDSGREEIARPPADNLNIPISPAAMAYVLYTSGSTGRPKGVVLTHGSASAFIGWAQTVYSPDEVRCVLASTSVCFDLSIFEIFLPLSVGGALYLVENALAVPDLGDAAQLTLINTVPSLLAELLRVQSLPGTVRTLNLAGEPLPLGLAQQVYAGGAVEKVYNLYGPTEDTTYSTCVLLERTGTRPPVIGRPVAGTAAYVLDRFLNLVPAGVPGELYLAGAGLARGYVNRPDLTAEKFVPNPFAATPGERLYRTGDLVRWQADGMLDYVGRRDHQVKVRGFRIELGEIEAALGDHPQVAQAAVLARADSGPEKRLVAYVVPQAEGVARDSGQDGEDVSNWETLWDDVYRQAGDPAEPEFNTVGWKSSYTGQPIPAGEMREWLDHTVAAILEWRPGRVLEIGCGTGMLLFQIAPQVDAYVGTDFSKQAIDDLEMQLRSRALPQVQVRRQRADDFSGMTAQAFDTIILNSVVQYFPHVQYLVEVLAQAVRAVAPGGRIFVGDVRHRDLLDAFHTEVELSQAAPETPLAALRQRVGRRARQEQELALSPEFFYALRQHLPEITRVEIRLKRGRAQNELTRFRYDAVLHVGAPDADVVTAEVLDWEAQALSAARIRQHLVDAMPAALVVRGVPNARLAFGLKAAAGLAQARPGETLGDLQQALSQIDVEGVNPEVFAEWQNELPYRVETRWAASGSPGRCDVAFHHTSRRAVIGNLEPPARTRAPADCANDPRLGRWTRSLVPQLRAFLQQRLPEYMVPWAFVVLDALPLSPNGKVDRQALPVPDSVRPEAAQQFEAPQTQIESTLAAIWARVLGLSAVGIHDNFFELGGDSILSLQIVSRAHQAGLRLTPKLIFQHPTIARLAAAAEPTPVFLAEQGLVTGPVPLTPIQQWFFERRFASPHQWNQSILLRTTMALDADLLSQAVWQLMAHHDALRTRFVETHDAWQQVTLGLEARPPFTVQDLSSRPPAEQSALIEAQAAAAQASLDLAAGPLCRVIYFKCGPGQPDRLLLVSHHLVVDGVSWRVLLEHLQTAYRQLSLGERVSLPGKTLSYKQWAERLQAYAGSEQLLAEADYWQRLPAGPAALPLDTGADEGSNVEGAADWVTTALDEAATRSLLTAVPAVYQTQIVDLLLTALLEALEAWTGERAWRFDLEGHGRESVFEDADLSRTVGWFTSLFPVWLSLGSSARPGDRLKAVKEQLRQVPGRGLGFGLLRYQTAHPQVAARLRQQPASALSFNYLGQLDQSLPEDGLVALAAESVGPTRHPQAQRPYLIEVEASVMGGQLRVSFKYAPALHHRATIERLARQFIDSLQALITHCLQPGVGGRTPSDFPLAALTQAQLDDLLVQHPPAALEDVYGLSPAQQGILFHTLYAPQASVYVEQLTCTLVGDLDVEVFRNAWQMLVERHASLRAAFLWQGLETPVQYVKRSVELPWTVLDWRETPEAGLATRLEAFLQADRAQGFDLTRAPLLRLSLIRLRGGAYQFVWCRHHLLLDGWSVSILLSELFTLYEALHKQARPRLAAVQPFVHYVGWLQQQPRADAEAFWRRMLKGFEAPVEMGVARHVVSTPGPEPARTMAWSLTPALTTAMQSFVRRHELTLNTLLQAAWALLLCHYGRATDVVFGVAVSGRPPALKGAEAMVGMFINTVPMRIQVDMRMPVLPWLRQLQARQIEINQFQHTPLVEVQGWSDLPRTQALFDTLLAFENYPVHTPGEGRESGLSVENIRTLLRTNYPISVLAFPGDPFSIEIAYDEQFAPDTIARMGEHLQVLLENLIAGPNRVLSQVTPLRPAERHQLLAGWNNTHAPVPPLENLARLVERQASAAPDAVAVETFEAALTYAELDARANQVAHYLVGEGVGPDVRVGLCLERSAALMIALLGIYKAGGAAVPLDPAYPAERLSLMLEEARVGLVIAQAGLHRQLPAAGSRRVDLERVLPAIERLPRRAPARTAGGETLAYVLYTSGSTGRPKGVAMSHHALLNLIDWQGRQLSLHAGARTLQFTSLSFDVSFQEIFSTWGTGGTLVLIGDDERRDPEALYDCLTRHAVDRLFLPFVALQQLAETARHRRQPPPALKEVITAGEQLTVTPAIEQLFERLPLCTLSNHYGPSETHVATALTLAHPTPQGPLWGVGGNGGRAGAARMDAPRRPPADWPRRVPIGRPVANTQVYVLDARLEPVPTGVAGALYIGGAGLARGYLNRPDLTAERFIPDPFGPQAGGRLYRTGDRARYLSGGVLEFLGRDDDQVKVRGYRVEPGEVEAALVRHPAVRDAAVVLDAPHTEAGPPGAARLVGFVVANAAPAPGERDLQDFLRQSLPEYMVPAALVVLDAMPLTPSGKLDRRALRVPGVEPAERQGTGAADPLEEMLAAIWADVLKVARVQRGDNFFELGGHSLLATQVVSRVRDVFNITLPLRDLFDAPHFSDFAGRVAQARRAGRAPTDEPLRARPRTEPLPLSFAQERLWFLDQLLRAEGLYSLPAVVRLQGRLDLAALEAAWRAVFERHEVFRTTVVMNDGVPAQQIAAHRRWHLPVIDARALGCEAREAEARRIATAEVRRRFDLSAGPLVRVSLIRLDDEDAVLCVVIHHIIADGWSFSVLMDEVAQLYQAYLEGRPSPLVPLAVQYADFALWQRQWLSGERWDSQLAYWKAQLAGSTPLELPTDFPRPPLQTHRGAVQPVAFSPQLTRSLKALSRREGVTLYMTLLAAFSVLLHRYTGQTDVSVGTPVAGRTVTDTERLIGYFGNTLVLRNDLSGDPTCRTLLGRVRDTTLDAYAHQEFPFEKLIDAIRPHRDLSQHPLFQVLFALHNTPRPTWQLPGLLASRVAHDAAAARFDLSLDLWETTDGLVGAFEYNADLFAPDTVTHWAAHFEQLLEAAVDRPESRISRLAPLPAASRQKLLADWNPSPVRAPDDTVIRRIEFQAGHIPDSVAVSCGSEAVTYEALCRRAGQWASYLLHAGVGPEERVGVYLERSPALVTALLAILKAGGAYVPLDPIYPRDRIAQILESARPAVVLTTRALGGGLPPSAGRVVYLDALPEDLPAASPESAPLSEGLAYVIFTSGSTGRPKGVQVTHGNLVSLLEAAGRAFDFAPDDVWSVFHSFAFDFSVWELWLPLARGSRIVLVPFETAQAPDAFGRLLVEQCVTVLNQTPSAMRALLAATARPERLRQIIVGGEALPGDLAAQLVGWQVPVWNFYGPTEATVWAAAHAVGQAEPIHTSVPVGRPLPNSQLFVLDSQLELVPPGGRGEVFIGGGGVARGYQAQPELTALAFIPHPFSAEPGARLYRTGDVGRWRLDGVLEFLGRSDHQVKIRGYRVELGEIEAALRALPQVQDCAVIVHDGGQARPGDRLVAYIVPAGGVARDPGLAARLRSQLKQRLSEYMLPSAFVLMEALPLTANRKLDRRALPSPAEEALETGAVTAPPRTPTEVELAAIWCDVLGLKRVGVHDNFFALGGHSLLLTQVAARLRQAFGVEVPLHALFEAGTIARLVPIILQKQGEQVAHDALEQILRDLEQMPDEG